ncbi:MAG: DedA family protein [bacterium]|nr:DedA family protein [bacterium]
MLAKIFATISLFILGFIEKIGYWGVFFLMALESANIPIPSEVIMPFSGFLMSQGHFNFLILIIIGALGNLFGSLVSYAIALVIGKPLIGYLKKIPFFADDYEKAEKFFSKHGNASIFWGRMLPIIRTFISFPAGIFKIPVWKFSFLTFSGSLIWSAVLTLIGFYLGENWASLEGYFRKFDYLIAIIIVVALGYYIYNKIKSRK